jgi:hypothetical protein
MKVNRLAQQAASIATAGAEEDIFSRLLWRNERTEVDHTSVKFECIRLDSENNLDGMEQQFSRLAGVANRRI